MTSEDYSKTVNEVRLRGRLCAPAEEKDLPSGDVLVTFRLVTDRPPSDDRQRVDTLDCSAVRPALRAKLVRAEPGDMLEINGRLRRRFWRAPNGSAMSRYSVDVDKVVNRSGRRGGVAPARKQASA